MYFFGNNEYPVLLALKFLRISMLLVALPLLAPSALGGWGERRGKRKCFEGAKSAKKNPLLITADLYKFSVMGVPPIKPPMTSV